MMFMGLLMGEPGLPSLQRRLREAGASTVWLLPFMAVSGHHVHKDMFGDHPGSWINLLRQDGFRIRKRISGTIEFSCFREIWLEHLDQVLISLLQTRP